jgi:hypothetical protein
VARRRNTTTTPRPVSFEIGFSFLPVMNIDTAFEYKTITVYKEAQLKALRDIYIQSLSSQTEEELLKRAKIATLIEVVHRTYADIPDTESDYEHLSETDSLINKAIWLSSMESGIRRALHGLLSGQISPRTNEHVITAFLLEEIQEAVNHLALVMRELNSANENPLSLPDYDERYIRHRSFVFRSPESMQQSSVVTMPSYNDTGYLSITNNSIRAAVGHLIELVRTDETVRSYLAEEAEQAAPARTDLNVWQIVSGLNGIEGVVLNGRRINAQSIQIRTEPGSVTRLNLEVLIVPTSDILSFTASPRPGYSDGGLRNVITPTPSPSGEEPRQHQPANVRRLDI